MKVIGRSAGRSAVAAAAYRIGDRLHDERTQLTHDYTKRSGVEAVFTVAPDHAPEWAKDPERLWNAAEAAERKSNSQLAREWEIALPSGVSAEERQAIARDFAGELVKRYGVVVTVALHKPSRHGDERNYHAHILMTTRRMGAEGLGEKVRELVDMKTGREEVRHMREFAAERINAALERAGSSEWVDHRSFKDRGIEQIPSEHLGVEAAAMERRGEKSGRGDRNRDIAGRNENIEAIQTERQELDRHITEAGQKSAREADSKASIFDASILHTHEARIREEGAVRHHGLVGKWYEQAAEWVQELRETVAQTWQLLIREHDPDNRIER